MSSLRSTIASTLRETLWRSEFFASFFAWLGTRIFPLFLALLVYKLAPRFGVQPLTLESAVLFFSELDGAVVAAIVASCITVIGFYAAFITAHSAWIAQQRMTLSIRAADEIIEHFQAAMRAIQSLQLYSDRISEYRTERAGNLKIWQLTQLRNQSDKARSAATDVQRLALDSFNLKQKHGLVLAQVAPGLNIFQQAAQHLQDISSLANFYIPTKNQTLDVMDEMFRSQLGATGASFSQATDQPGLKMMAKAASLHSILLRPVLKTTMYSVLDLIRSIVSARRIGTS